MPYNSEQKSIKIWQPLAFATVLIVGMLLGMRLQQEVPIMASTTATSVEGASTDKIEEVIRYIDAKYVDEVDREEIIQKVIQNVFKELDPHSNFIPAAQLKQINEQLDGNFEGIGIEFLVVQDTIVVMNAMKNGPSEKAGILSGDKIVAIEDSLFVEGKLDEQGIVKRLRGKKGSKVKVGILRNGEILHFDVIRDDIPINSVDAAYMLTETTGYIKVNRFSATTNTEFLSNLENLVDKEAMQNLVIDLRDNPGGYLHEATSILNQFFKDKDKLLVYTEGRKVSRSEHETTGKSFFSIDNIAVLIDEGSASASEILAGAIQDWDRGVIIGRRSFGKGLVQEQYNLKDGSAIRLTVARYFTPSGRSIQKSYNNRTAYEEDIATRFKTGELYDFSLAHLADTIPYYTNEGRTVYGGGGIIPDVFIPLDSLKMSNYFTQIQPHIRTYMFQYYLRTKEDLPYETIEEFINNFHLTEETLEDFILYAQSYNQEIDGNPSPEIRALSKLYLKARLAKHLFDDEGLYAVLNAEDRAVNKAIQILDMPNPLSILESGKKMKN